MTMKRILNVLVGIILFLSAIAAGAGLFWPATGKAFEMKSALGETVAITGTGLYRYDPMWGSVQAQGQDAVTLFIGVPALALALWLANKGSLRGKLLLAGLLGYFLYTYTTMAFGTWFNPLFLVYVALFGVSIYALILSFIQIDAQNLMTRISAKFPRRAIISVCFGVALFLLVAWLGRILPALSTGTAPYGLATYTTLFIQVMDLGVVVPLAVVGGTLLWRRHPFGYLLSVILMVKGASMGLALIAMMINMARNGVEASMVETVVFSSIAVVTLLLTGRSMQAVGE